MPTVCVRVAKRLLDVVAAGTGLLLTAPLFPMIAAAIKADSRGPVFIKQMRAGALLPGSDDNPSEMRFSVFPMYKFRSMRTDAEQLCGPVISSQGDPRVTRLGRVLRRTRLDELPQLWNVLRGDMSLVGPRPERPELLHNFVLAIPFFEERLRHTKPGLTGLAQVSLGYTGSIPDWSELAKFRDTLGNPYKLDGAEGALADDMRAKLLLDLAYAAAFEDLGTFLRMELGIIARTPLAMVRGLGR